MNQMEKWKGYWITHSWGCDANPTQGSSLAFRKDYYIDKEPICATICITASMRYALWINGVFVEDGPARSYPKEQIVDALNITQYLKEGNNTFAIIVQKPTGNSGYTLFHRMGLWINGEIKTETDTVSVETDDTWFVRYADWFIDTPFVYTIPLGKQEHYDGNREPAYWKISEPNEGWKEAFVLGGVGTPPWHTLKKSITKKPLRKPTIPVLIWKGSTSRACVDVKQINLTQAFEAHECKGSSIEPIEISGFIQSKDENVFVFDFGKTSYVSVGLEIGELIGSPRVELFYDIQFNERPHSASGFCNDYEGLCDSFTPSAVNKQWQGFLPRGFRFLTVKIVGEGNCALKLNTQIIEYNYGQTHFFQTSETILEKIWEVSKTTLLTATSDVIAETVRENVLWTFDACVGGKAAYYTFGDSVMWKHCLELVGQGIDEEGIPLAVVPAGYSFMILFDQTFYWVQSCKEYYAMTGDRDFINKMLPAMERLLRCCKKHITEEGLFIPPDYSWHWVDWAPLNKEPYSMPINAMLLMAAQAANSLVKALGASEDTSAYIIDLLSQSLLRFYDEKEAAFCSRIPVERPGKHNSINSSKDVAFDLHSNALAYLTQLGTKEQRSGGVRKMLDLLQEAEGKPIHEGGQIFGIAWTQIILEPLFAEGYIQEAMTCIERYYKPYLDQNTLTWGEDFTPSIYNTAHGWGACVNSLIIESICGIKPLQPNWRVVQIAPKVLKGINMDYRFNTTKGEIYYHYENEKLNVTVPEGVEVLFSESGLK